MYSVSCVLCMEVGDKCGNLLNMYSSFCQRLTIVYSKEQFIGKWALLSGNFSSRDFLDVEKI